VRLADLLGRNRAMPHTKFIPTHRSFRSTDWLVAVVVLAIATLPYVQYALHGEIPFFMDIVSPFYPVRLWTARLLHNWEWPFWNRTYFVGVPLLANPQWGLLYPGHWPFFLLPGPRTYTLTNALHIFAMGLGVFAWTRSALRERPMWGPLFAGVAVVLGGWTWAHLAFGAYFEVAMWAPWMFWAVERMRIAAPDLRSAVRWGLFAGMAGAMQWLAGAPQLSIYTQAALFFYLLVTAFNDRTTRRASLVFFGIQAIFALGLSAPQWMTTQAFLAECERVGALSLDQVRSGALDAMGILRAFIGGTGVPEDAESILYPGIAVLAFAIFSIPMVIRRKSTGIEIPIRAAVVVVSIALFASWSVLVPVLYRTLPMFDRFHDPRRAIFLGYLFCAFLAGIGFENLARIVRERWGRLASLCLGGVLIAGMAIELTHFAYTRIDVKHARTRAFLLDDPEAATGVRPGERFFAWDLGLQYTYNYTRKGFAESLLPDLGTSYGMEDIQGYDPFIPWRTALYFRRMNSLPHPEVTLYPSHFALVRSIDSPWLSRFAPFKVCGPIDCAWPFLPPRWIRPGESVDIPLSIPLPIDRHLLEDVRLYLAYVNVAGGDRDVDLEFVANKQVVATLRGHASASSAESGEATMLWPDVLPPPDASISPVYRAACRIVKTNGDVLPSIESVRVRNAGATTPILLYAIGLPRKLRNFVPTVPGTFASTAKRGFPKSVYLHRMAADAERSKDRVQWRNLYERWAMTLSPDCTNIEIPPGESDPGVPSYAIDNWTWKRKSANRLDIALPQGHSGGWLVLAEPYAKGWRCLVDGTDTPIRVADTQFRAIAVASGAREVTMTYHPPRLMLGIAIAFATGALGLLGLFALVPKRDARSTIV
jgi:hypothetical protein